ncbi:autotransporter assembly complex protein TamA [Pseudoalteromonas fenneropenaei]|uniref:autotransporter assembly complex protein TamA n=1 Tax=Pseudoalteromonas fenneropenaei TaxID=1737459 RepID=UPI00366E7A78
MLRFCLLFLWSLPCLILAQTPEPSTINTPPIAGVAAKVADVQLPEVKVQEIEVPSIPSLLADNIRAHLQTLLDKPMQQVNSDYVYEQSNKALQAFGYYESEVTLQWDKGGEVLKVNVLLNEPYRWFQVHVTVIGSGEEDEILKQIIADLAIKKDQVVNHGQYEAAKKQLEDHLLEFGYFDFKWLKSQLLVSKQRRRARAVLSLDTGPRYQFGALAIAAGSRAQHYVEKLAPFKQNEPYQASMLGDYSLSLNETPYFNSVRIYPELSARQNQQVPVRVEVVDKPANSFEVGGGFSTDLGAKGRFRWSKPWVSDDGHYLDTDLSVSERQQDVTASYTIPVEDPVQDVWRVSGGYKLEDGLTEDIFSRVVTLQLQRQWLTEENWVRTAFVRREKEQYDVGTGLRTSHMTIPGISWAKKQRRGGTLPYWGEERLFAIEGANEDLASSTSMLRLQWQNAWLRSWEQHYFYGRIDLGAIISDHIESVPFSLRFYAGGDQSIRGFKYQSISPEENGEKTGGRYLVTGTTEYQYQFAENWRAALFVDAGTATNDFSEKLSVGAGFGFRYLTPIGPIRFDHAWGLSKESNSTRLSIVIGPEI